MQERHPGLRCAAHPACRGLQSGSPRHVVAPSTPDSLYNPPMLFDLVQTIYWLALATWFGGVLFIALAAPIIFRTVRDNNPILPTVLSVNLEGQHGTLLAGSIVANLLAALQRIELACAGGLFVAILGQWLVLRPT